MVAPASFATGKSNFGHSPPRPVGLIGFDMKNLKSPGPSFPQRKPIEAHFRIQGIRDLRSYGFACISEGIYAGQHTDRGCGAAEDFGAGYPHFCLVCDMWRRWSDQHRELASVARSGTQRHNLRVLRMASWMAAPRALENECRLGRLRADHRPRSGLRNGMGRWSGLCSLSRGCWRERETTRNLGQILRLSCPLEKGDAVPEFLQRDDGDAHDGYGNWLPIYSEL
jgi:hypothetical protein